MGRKKFKARIRENVAESMANLMACDFSTTSEIEYTASLIGLLCTMQKYFKYHCIPRCGINTVYIAGTLEDWQNLRNKTESLGKYELEWWISKVLPIIDQIIEAYKGKADLEFWNEVAILKSEKAGSGKLAYFNGWIKNLYPYTASGEKVGDKMLPSNFPQIEFGVPFTMEDHGGSISKMKFLAAYTGMHIDEGGIYKPQLTIAIAKEIKK